MVPPQESLPLTRALAMDGVLATRRTERLLWIALWGLFGWFAYGAFPISDIHGDAVQEAAGIEHLARYGWDAPVLTHNTAGCPGVTLTVLSLRRWTGVHASVLLGLLSLVSGIVFSLSAGGMLRRLTGIPTPLAAMVCLLFPIVAVLGMYSNDMITSAALAVTAFRLFCGPITMVRLLAGALCLSLAGWFRGDAILVTGTIPFLLHRGSFRVTVTRTLIVGCAAGCLALTWVHLSGSSVAAMVHHARAVTMTSPALAPTIMLYLSFVPLGAVYGIYLGLASIIRRRAWGMAGLAATGIIPLWLFMMNKLPFPKLYTHAVPWFALLICVGLQELWTSAPSARRRRRSVLLGVLVAGQCLFGLQIDMRAKPWWNSPQTVLLRVGELDFQRGPVSHAALVIGPGTFNPMGHAGMPASGLLFTPLAMHAEHDAIRRWMSDYIDYLGERREDELKFFSNTHLGIQSTVYALTETGYRCVANETFGPADCWRLSWTRDGRRVTQYRLGGISYDMHFLRSIGELQGVYVMTTGREEATVLDQTVAARLITRCAVKSVLAVYEVTFPPL